MQQVGVLPVNVSKNLDWRLELDKRSLVLEGFGCFFKQKLNHLNGQINERYALGIFRLVLDDVVVKVIDGKVHDELSFVGHIFFEHARESFLELLSPLFLHIHVLLVGHVGSTVLVKQGLQLLLVILLVQSLLGYARQEALVVLRQLVLPLVQL